MTTLKVPDMTCQHCVATITKLIQQQDPAAQVQTDLALHTVSVDSKRRKSDFSVGGCRLYTE